MKGRILLGGILGGLAMFAWGFVSHAMLGLTDRSIMTLDPAHEAQVIAALQTAAPRPGLYIYPTLGMRMGNDDPAAMKRLDEAVRTMPSGIITMSPPSPKGMMPPAKLVYQLLGDVFACLVAGIMLGMTRLAAYGSRVLFVAMLGLFAGFLVNLPYWNWYGFPTSFTLPDMLDHVLRSVAGGLVLGAVVKPR